MMNRHTSVVLPKSRFWKWAVFWSVTRASFDLCESTSPSRTRSAAREICLSAPARDGGNSDGAPAVAAPAEEAAGSAGAGGSSHSASHPPSLPRAPRPIVDLLLSLAHGGLLPTRGFRAGTGLGSPKCSAMVDHNWWRDSLAILSPSFSPKMQDGAACSLRGSAGYNDDEL